MPCPALARTRPRAATTTGREVQRITPWTAVPRDLLESFGDIVKFCGRALGDIFNGRIIAFFGEALRQAGILILGSALVI